MKPFAFRENVYWAKIRADALIPKNDNYMFELYASSRDEYLIAKPHSYVTLETGLSFACSNDYYLELNASTELSDYGIISFPQIVDYSNREEITIKVLNTNTVPIVFSIYSQQRIEKIANLSKKYKKYIFFPLSNVISRAYLRKVNKCNSREINLQALQTIPLIEGDDDWKD